METYRHILAICGFEIEDVSNDTFRIAMQDHPIGGWTMSPRTTIAARRVH